MDEPNFADRGNDTTKKEDPGACLSIRSAQRTNKDSNIPLEKAMSLYMQ